ncbi:MAG: hypothetical protein LBL90_01730 [Prevotellaceae bacterium]|nr:hypothetical protein [Prevotellaceae bacterium]
MQCGSNQLKELDVLYKLLSLTELNCSNNKLSFWNVNKYTKL